MAVPDHLLFSGIWGIFGGGMQDKIGKLLETSLRISTGDPLHRRRARFVTGDQVAIRKELDDEDDYDTDARTCVRVPRRDRRRRRECLFADPRRSLGFVATAGVARPGEAIHVDAARRR